VVVDEVEVEAVVGEASLLEVVAGVLPGVEVEEEGDVEAWVEERRLLWNHTGMLECSLLEAKRMLW